MGFRPLTVKYPFYSPYSFSGNRVIDAIELEGLEPYLLEGNNSYQTSSSVETTETAQYRVNTYERHPYTPEEKYDILGGWQNTQSQNKGTGEMLMTGNYTTKTKIIDRPYNVNNGVKLPTEITTKDNNGESITTNIHMGAGFDSDGYATPNNKISQKSVDGFIKGVKLANQDGAGIVNIYVSATTNGHHGNSGAANWHISASNHYVKNGARAIDVGLLNGFKPNSDSGFVLSLKLQSWMDSVSTINENFGPNFKHKKGVGVSVGGHNTWMHFSFK